MADTDNNQLALSDIALKIKDDVDAHLPLGFAAIANASHDDLKTITITITDWPATFPALSRDHLIAERQAVLGGRMPSDRPHYQLSAEALDLILSLQVVLEPYIPDGIIGEIIFDERVLKAEHLRFLQSLKKSCPPNESPPRGD